MAPSEKVQLLSMWASGFVMRVQVALALKGVEYENVPQDLRNKSELLLQSNPVYKKVPVLIHNGRCICESLNIVEYVDETWPSPDGRNILPADAYERARARFWADFVDKKLFDALMGAVKASVKGLAEEKAAAESDLVALLSALEETLPGEGPFFGGGQMGFVDVALAPMLPWMAAFEEVAQLHIPWEEKLPRLQAFVEAMRAHPATAELPEPSKMAEFAYTTMIPMLRQS